MIKVMLVEDEELILEGLRDFLDWESMGMLVTHMACNGQEALNMLEEESADIVVTDISMSVMDGLTFLKELRARDSRTRCIILTGYDTFEYARQAIGLDVEDYILKPIDEVLLTETLKRAVQRLEELDSRETAGWAQYLKGQLPKDEAEKYLSILREAGKSGPICAAVMKLKPDGLEPSKFSDVLAELKKEEPLQVFPLPSGSLLLLYHGDAENSDALYAYFFSLSCRLENDFSVRSFISVSSVFEDYARLPEYYKEAMKLQKYQVIEGYGSCVMPPVVHDRQSADISIDDKVLRKLIFSKDKEGVHLYIEDLFINNVRKDAAIGDIYQMALHIAMILQEVKKEYKLDGRSDMQELMDIVEKINDAEDLLALKTIFISEAFEIITCLNEDDSQYTPVVKQIMAQVQKNYREDMNLKTLAYKYHMNASYLGQIFQREVGCSFAQYLSNIKNETAKDLILNTNMRINDIAKEVGYPDTSYFYRKFKQCYGVSPASLREMKKY